MKDKNIRELSMLMERVTHKYVQLEQKKRKFGTNTYLTRVEIHTIVVVAENPGISVTELAKKQGITKGAASQMIYKLVDKDMVEKRISPDSDSQVSLSVTENGKIAYEGHENFHRRNDTRFFKLLNDLPDDTYNNFSYVLGLIENALDERLDK